MSLFVVCSALGFSREHTLKINFGKNKGISDDVNQEKDTSSSGANSSTPKSELLESFMEENHIKLRKESAPILKMASSFDTGPLIPSELIVPHGKKSVMFKTVGIRSTLEPHFSLPDMHVGANTVSSFPRTKYYPGRMTTDLWTSKIQPTPVSPVTWKTTQYKTTMFPHVTPRTTALSSIIPPGIFKFTVSPYFPQRKTTTPYTKTLPSGLLRTTLLPFTGIPPYRATLVPFPDSFSTTTMPKTTLTPYSWTTLNTKKTLVTRTLPAWLIKATKIPNTFTSKTTLPTYMVSTATSTKAKVTETSLTTTPFTRTLPAWLMKATKAPNTSTSKTTLPTYTESTIEITEAKVTETSPTTTPFTRTLPAWLIKATETPNILTSKTKFSTNTGSTVTSTDAKVAETSSTMSSFTLKSYSATSPTGNPVSTVPPVTESTIKMESTSKESLNTPEVKYSTVMSALLQNFTKTTFAVKGSSSKPQGTIITDTPTVINNQIVAEGTSTPFFNVTSSTGNMELNSILKTTESALSKDTTPQLLASIANSTDTMQQNNTTMKPLVTSTTLKPITTQTVLTIPRDLTTKSRSTPESSSVDSTTTEARKVANGIATTISRTSYIPTSSQTEFIDLTLSSKFIGQSVYASTEYDTSTSFGDTTTTGTSRIVGEIITTRNPVLTVTIANVLDKTPVGPAGLLALPVENTTSLQNISTTIQQNGTADMVTAESNTKATGYETISPTSVTSGMVKTTSPIEITPSTSSYTATTPYTENVNSSPVILTSGKVTVESSLTPSLTSTSIQLQKTAVTSISPSTTASAEQNSTGNLKYAIIGEISSTSANGQNTEQNELFTTINSATTSASSILSTSSKAVSITTASTEEPFPFSFFPFGPFDPIGKSIDVTVRPKKTRKPKSAKFVDIPVVFDKSSTSSMPTTIPTSPALTSVKTAEVKSTSAAKDTYTVTGNPATDKDQNTSTMIATDSSSTAESATASTKPSLSSSSSAKIESAVSTEHGNFTENTTTANVSATRASTVESRSSPFESSTSTVQLESTFTITAADTLATSTYASITQGMITEFTSLIDSGPTDSNTRVVTDPTTDMTTRSKIPGSSNIITSTEAMSATTLSQSTAELQSTESNQTYASSSPYSQTSRQEYTTESPRRLGTPSTHYDAKSEAQTADRGFLNTTSQPYTTVNKSPEATNATNVSYTTRSPVGLTTSLQFDNSSSVDTTNMQGVTKGATLRPEIELSQPSTLTSGSTTVHTQIPTVLPRVNTETTPTVQIISSTLRSATASQSSNYSSTSLNTDESILTRSTSRANSYDTSVSFMDNIQNSTAETMAYTSPTPASIIAGNLVNMQATTKKNEIITTVNATVNASSHGPNSTAASSTSTPSWTMSSNDDKTMTASQDIKTSFIKTTSSYEDSSTTFRTNNSGTTQGTSSIPNDTVTHTVDNSSHSAFTIFPRNGNVSSQALNHQKTTVQPTTSFTSHRSPVLRQQNDIIIQSSTKLPSNTNNMTSVVSTEDITTEIPEQTTNVTSTTISKTTTLTSSTVVITTTPMPSTHDVTTKAKETISETTNDSQDTTQTNEQETTLPAENVVKIDHGDSSVTLKGGFKTICEPHNITVLVDKAVIGKYEELYGPLHLNDDRDPSCRGIEYDTFFRYTIAPDILACGTMFVVNETHVNFTNTVSNQRRQEQYYKKMIDSSGTVMVGSRGMTPLSLIHMGIVCTFPLDITISTDYAFIPNIVIDVARFNVSGKGQFSAIMQLYKDRNYQSPHFGAPSLRPDDTLRVGVTLLETKDDDIYISVRKCWATPVRAHDFEQFYPLIEDYCPVTGSLKGNLTILENGNSKRSRWQGPVFKFVKYEEVWLHCELKVCFQDFCNKTCDNGRSKRSAWDKLNIPAVVSAGPIYIRPDGNRETTEVPGKLPSETGKDNLEETTIIIIVVILSIVIFVSCILFIFVLTRCRRRKSKQVKTSLPSVTAPEPAVPRARQVSIHTIVSEESYHGSSISWEETEGNYTIKRSPVHQPNPEPLLPAPPSNEEIQDMICVPKETEPSIDSISQSEHCHQNPAFISIENAG